MWTLTFWRGCLGMKFILFLNITAITVITVQFKINIQLNTDELIVIEFNLEHKLEHHHHNDNDCHICNVFPKNHIDSQRPFLENIFGKFMENNAIIKERKVHKTQEQLYDRNLQRSKYNFVRKLESTNIVKYFECQIHAGL